MISESALQENVYRAEERLKECHDWFAIAMEADACDAELEYHSQNIEMAEFELEEAYDALYSAPCETWKRGPKRGDQFGEWPHVILTD
tara:strand:+ start:333 stop:596 length:264 start_codon:yes stop_codon:yes gene_type:complete